MSERKHFDSRTYDRYIDKGLITDADFKKHISSLPDDTNQAEWVPIDMHDGELGEGANTGFDSDK